MASYAAVCVSPVMTPPTLFLSSQDSLGGNAKTRVIATLTPASDCVDESVSTIKFADRAKQVMPAIAQPL